MILYETQPPLLQAIGLWLGFTISLFVFSMIVRENALSRLALHLLVGTSLGYAALLAWQEVLQPLLFAPLLADGRSNGHLLIPLVLGLLLTVAGLEQIFRPRATSARPARWRRMLGLLGALPIALIVGLSIAIVTLGSIQGTLAPQTLRAAATGLQRSQGLIDLAVGALMLLITTGALLHLRVKPERDLSGQPPWARNLLLGWMAIGKRGLWLAAGALFARLMASRFSLLIARIGALAAQLEEAGLWDWLR